MFVSHQSRTERYVKDAFQWMVPFLHRCEGQREGAAKSLLKEYMVSLAQHDLTLPLLVFQHSKPDVSIQTRRRGHTRATYVRAAVVCLAVCAVSRPGLHP